MDQVRVSGFRCFSRPQVAELAPLTLLVGENSTGKTSFMAMVRALWQVAYESKVPNFKEPPYGLGSSEEMANTMANGRTRRSFQAGFTGTSRHMGGLPFSFDVRFGQQGTAPVPVSRTVHDAESEVIVEQRRLGGRLNVHMRVGEKKWFEKVDRRWLFGGNSILPMVYAPMVLGDGKGPERGSDEGLKLARLLDFAGYPISEDSGPFASAPVRSKPKRTYDPSIPSRDPEGDYMPS